MSSKWEKHPSKTYNGKEYWFNKSTGQVSWEEPSSMEPTSDPIALVERLFSGGGCARTEKSKSIGEGLGDLAEHNSESVNAIADKMFQISLQSVESAKAVLNAHMELVVQLKNKMEWTMAKNVLSQRIMKVPRKAGTPSSKAESTLLQLTTQLQHRIDDIDFNYLVDYVIQQPRDEEVDQAAALQSHEVLGKLRLHQLIYPSLAIVTRDREHSYYLTLRRASVERQKEQIISSLATIVSALANAGPRSHKATTEVEGGNTRNELTRFKAVMSCLITTHVSSSPRYQDSSTMVNIFRKQSAIIEHIKTLSKSSIVSPEVRAAFKSVTEEQYEHESSKTQAYKTPEVSGRIKADLLKTLPLSNIGKYAVILLLGPPGIGKSHLGKLLVANGLASNFLDVGHRLLARGDTEESQRVPTDAQRQHLHEAAVELLSTSLQSYFETDGELPLVITFVKAVSDTYTFLDTVKTTAQCHGGRQGTVQVWYLRDDDFVSTKDRGADSVEKSRLHKWMNNNAGILEVFAATGALSELTKERASSDRFSSHQFLWKVSRRVPAFTPLPLECDLTTRNRITGEMKSLLGVTELLPALPLSFLQNNEQQIRWLSYPGRYWVSHKADGTRYVLYIDISDNGWLLNRAGSLYRIPSSSGEEATQQSCTTGSSPTGGAAARPPAGTIFDGELVTATDGKLVYLAFDVLHFQGRRTWHRPFSDRISLLQTWDSSRKRSGAAYASIAAIAAIASSSLSIVLKASYPVSQPGAVAGLLDRQQDGRAGFFKVDGLIFTPELPYTFGRDALLFKWQSPDDVKADLDFSSSSGNNNSMSDALIEATSTRRGGVSSSTSSNMFALLDAPSRAILGTATTTTTVTGPRATFSFRNPPLPPLGFIYECNWSKLHKTWLPRSIRFDKTDCNAPKTIASIESMLKSSVKVMLTSANLVDVFNAAKIPMLHMDMSSIQQGLNQVAAEEEMKRPIDAARHRHPARSMDFDSLLRDVYDLVSDGLVEKYVHPDTGLEVFSYLDRERKTPPQPPPASLPQVADEQAATQSCCSGSDGKNDDPGERKRLSADVCRGLILHPASKTVVANAFVRFFKLTRSEVDALSDCIVRASTKYDGSLIIAFLWQGQLHTSTRRRMDSEQALWATERLRSSPAVLAEFKPHWTYLLELVGGNNAHAIDYTFEETLIFISAFNEEGKEVDLTERLAIAKRADLFAVQPIEGRLCEFLATLHDPTAAAAAAAAVAAPRVLAPVAKRGGEAVGDKRAVSWSDTVKASVAHASRLYLPASCEGWVVESPNDGRRFKLINPIWDRASGAMKRLLHPVAVWDQLRMGRVDSLLNHSALPRHARREVQRMTSAIAASFDAPIIANAMLAHQPPSSVTSKNEEEGHADVKTAAAAAAAASASTLSQQSVPESNRKPDRSAAGIQIAPISATLADAIADDDAILLTSTMLRADADGIAIDCEEVLSLLEKHHSRSIGLIPLLPSHQLSSTGTGVNKQRFDVLRLLLLHCARPQPSGSLPGYQPGPWLAQTYAKGWKTIPVAVCTDMLSWGAVGNSSSLFDRLMEHESAAKLLFEMLAPPPPSPTAAAAGATTATGSSEQGLLGLFSLASLHAPSETASSTTKAAASKLARCQAVPRLLTVCKSWRDNLTAMFRGDLVKWKQEGGEARSAVERAQQEEHAASMRRMQLLMPSSYSGSRGGGYGGGSDNEYNFGYYEYD